MAELEIVGGIKDHFTMIPNDIFRDPNISPRAVKLYGFLRSHTSGFHVNMQGLGTQMNMGKNSVNAAIKELEELGYVVRKWKQNGNLRQGMIYQVLDSRCPYSRDTENSGSREPGFPETGTHKEEQFLKEDQVFKEHQSAPTGAPPPLSPSKEESTRSKPVGEHRLPDDWGPSETKRKTLEEKYPGVPIDAELKKFHTYWHNKTGKQALKKDWDKTFSNWLSKAKPRKPTREEKLARVEQWRKTKDEPEVMPF